MAGPIVGEGQFSDQDNQGLQAGDAEFNPIDPEGDSRSDETRNSDVNTEKSSERSRGTWSAQLPPGSQKALRAGGRAKLPRAYEDRLQRYFERLK